MFETFFQLLKQNNFYDIKGNFQCKIPFSIKVVNALLNKAEEDKEAIKTLEVKAINGDEVTFNITLGGMRYIPGFDLLDRDFVLKIHPVLKAPDWILKIEIFDGIKKMENRVLEFVFNTWFKNNLVDFENRVMLINHRELNDTTAYQFLLDNLENAKLITEEDKIIYDLTFNFK